VNKAIATITWDTPAPVPVGTALGSAQLDASANVAGRFVYSPAAGTVMNAAGTQTLPAATCAHLGPSTWPGVAGESSGAQVLTRVAD
jgi:hypothetical protein